MTAISKNSDFLEHFSKSLNILFFFLSKSKGLSQDASRLTSKEEDQRESCPFGRLATKLGLPANCDIDLRKQEELEVHLLNH